MKTSNEVKNIYKALADFQAVVPPQYKEGQGHHGKYTKFGGMVTNIKPLLIKAGLSVIQSPTTPKPEYWPAVAITTRIIHAESCEWIEDTMTAPFPKTTQPFQDAGKGVTYEKRYMLMAMLFIVDGDDNDGYVTPPKELSTNSLTEEFGAALVLEAGEDCQGDLKKMAEWLAEKGG